MVHQEEDQNRGQASTSPAVTPAETDSQTPADKFNKKESSSSSSASSENIDEDDFFQIEGPILGSTISFSHNAAIKEQSGSSSNPESHAPTDPKQSPRVQAMSRAPDECPDPKRIPSSVFARSKSTTPTDWSVTSNESLFSINVGNASFSKDHFFLYGKSGEMGNPNDPLAPLPPLPRPSTSSSPIRSEGAKTTVQASAKLKPATKEGDQDGDDKTDYNHSLSHRSDASTTSFAFPILAGGDVKNSGFMKDDSSELARQSTSQLSQQAEPVVEQEAPKVEAEAPEAEQAPEPAPPSTSAAEPTPQPSAPAKWFPCCSCCPFCC
ncbi:hypothetical protein SETIT_2G108600v2 [Setaria italica]|uniref:Uncharacterized protein n=1 Tax=Setaria italica TaxID=4555 RepID=A0A368PXQ6_SETIT|nr:actin cytoskeleton-regulatory complex protein pan1 [Setaria italica]RCV10393.1 hypothetical protein SETIT_2G108600v2 [Setaria italica]